MTDETANHWRSLLGEDVVLLTHGQFTARIAASFFHHDADKLSSRDQTRLEIAALIHDWGEIMIGADGVGDISYDQKTRAHEASEAEIFNRVIGTIANRRAQRTLKSVYKGIALDQRSRLGRVFNAIERLGYLHTALRAFQGDQDGRRIANWRGLVGNVLANQLTCLLAHGQTYHTVANFLRLHARDISLMAQETTPLPVPLDRHGSAAFDRAALLHAAEVWRASDYYSLQA